MYLLTVCPGLTFDQIGKAIGKDETWVAAAFYAQVTIPSPTVVYEVTDSHLSYRPSFLKRNWSKSVIS